MIRSDAAKIVCHSVCSQGWVSIRTEIYPDKARPYVADQALITDLAIGIAKSRSEMLFEIIAGMVNPVDWGVFCTISPGNTYAGESHV